MTKLSKVQLEVLQLMANGWELGKEMSFDGRTWMQKGGLGRGGESKKLSFATVYKLWKEQYIFTVSAIYPTEKYALTEKGKQAVNQE